MIMGSVRDIVVNFDSGNGEVVEERKTPPSQRRENHI